MLIIIRTKRERDESCHVMTCTLSLFFPSRRTINRNMMIVNGVFSACSKGIIITNNSSPLMSLRLLVFSFPSLCALSVVRDDQHILYYFSFVCPWSRAYISRFNWICWFDTVNTIFFAAKWAFIINWLMTSHQ